MKIGFRKNAAAFLLLASSNVHAQPESGPSARSASTATSIATSTATPATTVLDPVVVTATRLDTEILDTPASISVVEGYDLRRDQPQINLSEGLSGVPGLQIQNRQNYAQDLQISIRGFGARSTFGVRGVRLYVDGIPATMPDGQGQTSNIDIASIESVEVLRGPFSAQYGNASGGVMVINTERGEDPPSLSSDFSAGSYGTYRYGLKASGVLDLDKTEMDYLLSANRFTTQGYRDHSGARKNLFNAKLGFDFASGNRLTLVANHVDLTADDPLGLTRQDFEQNPRSVVPNALAYNTRKTVRQTQGGLRYEHTLNADNELTAQVYAGRRHTVQYLAIPDFVQQNLLQAGGVIDLTRDYYGTDLRLTTQLSLANRPFTLIAGVAYDAMKEGRKGYRNYIDTPQGRKLGVQGELRRNERNTVWNLDPYIQTSWEFAPRFTLDLGARYSTVHFDSADRFIQGINGDDSGSARYQAFSPMGSLAYAVSNNTQVYVSAGRGFETPTFNELSYRTDGGAGLNFGLQPAYSTTFEVGFKTMPTDSSLLTASVFQTRTRDEIVSAGPPVPPGGNRELSGRTSYQNAGRTKRTGFELAYTNEWGRHWRADVAYTWLNARYQDDCVSGPCANPAQPAQYLQAGNRIPGIAEHAVFAALGWAPPTGWRAGVEGRFLSNIAVNDGNTESAPSYAVFALSTGYTWLAGPWEVSAFARVDNVFDKDYAGSVIVNEGVGRYYEPAPGRNWTAGVQARFMF